MPGRVKALNNLHKMYNGRLREIDIDLGDVFVQVKGGAGDRLAKQIGDTVQTTGVRTVGYAPDMKHGAWKAALLEGTPIARTTDELVSIVKELG
jgi:hypothetical protein